MKTRNLDSGTNTGWALMGHPDVQQSDPIASRHTGNRRHGYMDRTLNTRAGRFRQSRAKNQRLKLSPTNNQTH